MALPSNQASVPTAASRPGGKFGGGGGRRGKFASLAAASAKKDSGDDEKAAGGATDGISSDRGAAAAATAAAEAAARRRARSERQARIFADIDEAEDLSLDLLTLASSTASALSDLTTVSIAAEGGEEGEQESAKKKLEELVRGNGDEYLEKVKRVHALLVPHAELVVAYRNHAVDAEVEPHQVKMEEDAATGGDEKEGEGEKPVQHRNMYAARVEMRLAMERRDIMKELLRLEKDDAQEAAKKDGAVPDDGRSGKRKREDAT